MLTHNFIFTNTFTHTLTTPNCFFVENVQCRMRFANGERAVVKVTPLFE